jgi:DNA-binding GntR family transcriptional regulator
MPEVEVGAPLLVISRTTTDSGGEPIEFSCDLLSDLLTAGRVGAP